MTPARRLERSFYAPLSQDVAPALLNKLLVVADGRSGRIVEVEAYGSSDDPASHSYRGVTGRNEVMFGPPGRLYVYFIYGVHWCANVVCGPAGEASAVLIRALQPVAGIDEMRMARWPTGTRGPDRDLCRGPGRLTQALGITKAYNGLDLVGSDTPIWLADDGVDPPSEPQVTARIGISVGQEHLWRFTVPGHPAASPRRSPRTGRTPKR